MLERTEKFMISSEKVVAIPSENAQNLTFHISPLPYLYIRAGTQRYLAREAY